MKIWLRILFINGIKHVANLIKIKQSLNNILVNFIPSKRIHDSHFLKSTTTLNISFIKSIKIPNQIIFQMCQETQQFYSMETTEESSHCQLIHPISKHRSSQRSPSPLNEISSKLIRVSTLYWTHFRYHARGSNSSKDQADWHSLLTFFAVFRRSEGIDRWPSWHSSVPRPL